jgi:alpha/beta superfamily hydrolase
MEDTFWAPKMASYLKGWTVYSFNYRGFGESKGYASEMNAKGDALAIYEFVKSMHPEVETEFALMGRSLGTSFALWLAQKVNPTSLILVSPFCSLRSVIRGKLWLAPFSVLAHKRFCNSDLAPSIAARTLFILAEQDRAIAHHDSLHLAKVFGVPPIVAIIDGTDHRTVPRSRGAQRAIANFLTGIALSEC